MVWDGERPDPVGEQNDGDDYIQSSMPSPSEEPAGVFASLAAGQQSQMVAAPRSVNLPEGFAPMYWNGRLIVYRPGKGTVNMTQAGQGIGMTLGQNNYKLGQRKFGGVKGQSKHHEMDD